MSFIAALVFDDEAGDGVRPGWFWPYFHTGIFDIDDARDYANPLAVLRHKTHQFVHPLASVVQALIDAGLSIEMLHEHDGVAWKAFASLIEGEGRLWRFPDKPWLPLSYSIKGSTQGPAIPGEGPIPQCSHLRLQLLMFPEPTPVAAPASVLRTDRSKTVE